MTTCQPGGVIVVEPHLLPGKFKDYCSKTLFIVKNTNIIYIDKYSIEGMIETKRSMEKTKNFPVP